MLNLKHKIYTHSVRSNTACFHTNWKKCFINFFLLPANNKHLSHALVAHINSHPNLVSRSVVLLCSFLLHWNALKMYISFRSFDSNYHWFNYTEKWCINFSFEVHVKMYFWHPFIVQALDFDKLWINTSKGTASYTVGAHSRWPLAYIFSFQFIVQSYHYCLHSWKPKLMAVNGVLIHAMCHFTVTFVTAFKKNIVIVQIDIYT